MLTVENNEYLTRVGAGTPMGDLMRRYWLPFLFPWEIEADGSPERVRLLGEDLVVFRDTNGKVGLVAENCPHRGASLYFGRNEECGLRCIYHGWKYDVTGECVDMPSEPEESNFKTKVHLTSYPTVTKGGIIWAYMGPQDPPPPLPGLEWLDLPEEHSVASKRVQYTNWLQAMEGDIDQSHVSFVHSRLRIGERTDGPARGLVEKIRALDKHPRFQVIDTDYGVCIGAGRDAPDGMKYWRITQHLMPFHTMTGPYGENPTRNWRAWVPIDDENTFVIGLTFHPLQPITGEQRERSLTRSGVWNISPQQRAPKTSAAFGRWRPIPSMDNDFLQDREIQRKETYSGIDEFWAQDAAPQYSMGPIYDRSKEHLGTSDGAIIRVRSRLLRAAKALRESSEEPDEVAHPEVYQVRSDALLVPEGESWVEATVERRKAIPGYNPACT